MLRDYAALMRALTAVTTLAVAVAVPLTGCGIKGPLTLPPAPAAPTAAAPAVPAAPATPAGSPTPAASSEAAPATPPPLPATKP
jgi:diaminopimelate decarboxylase